MAYFLQTLTDILRLSSLLLPILASDGYLREMNGSSIFF